MMLPHACPHLPHPPDTKLCRLVYTMRCQVLVVIHIHISRYMYAFKNVENVDHREEEREREECNDRNNALGLPTSFIISVDEAFS